MDVGTCQVPYGTPRKKLENQPRDSGNFDSHVDSRQECFSFPGVSLMDAFKPLSDLRWLALPIKSDAPGTAVKRDCPVVGFLVHDARIAGSKAERGSGRCRTKTGAFAHR
jgi:hypothetical protein